MESVNLSFLTIEDRIKLERRAAELGKPVSFVVSLALSAFLSKMGF